MLPNFLEILTDFKYSHNCLDGVNLFFIRMLMSDPKWKSWMKFILWTLAWGGGTIWLTLAIMKSFKGAAKYF